MREIEFRAWDNYDKIMLYCPSGPVGEYSFSRPAGYGAIELIPFKVVYYQLVWPQPKGGITFYDPSRYELMQYTGLKDKSGTPIFEGDIVAENGFKPAVIKFGTYQNNQERWGFDDSGYGYYCENEEDGQCGLDASIDTFEVIGNIYSNPGLVASNLKDAA